MRPSAATCTHTSLTFAAAIDVLKGNGGAPNLTGNFTISAAGYAPFDIQNLGGVLYVTYAVQDGAKHDDVAGAGNGIVDAYDLQGNLMRRWSPTAL